MPNSIDLTAQRFARLLVIERTDNAHGQVQWKCRCDCGTIAVVPTKNLRGGLTKSCGCLLAERNRARLTTHGRTKTREYRSLAHAKSRCYDRGDRSYSDYGGRGITVCARWLTDFAAFFADMGLCPLGHSLDRRDNDGPYSPDNCRWATPHEQAANKRNNRRLTFNGQTLTCAEWARQQNMTPAALELRLNKLRWPIGRALTEPMNTKFRSA